MLVGMVCINKIMIMQIKKWSVQSFNQGKSGLKIYYMKDKMDN
jgi:hypothetical protein